jgi:ABC-2 type transport system permease protein
MIFKKVVAFIKRDLLNESSYKLAFLMQFFGIFLSVATFYFLSRLFGATANPYLKSYGGDYFSFVLIGIAFMGYLGVSLNSLSSTIRTAQVKGTLEALLVTQTEIPTIILSSSAYSFIFTSLRVIVYLLIGVLLFGVSMKGANYLGALLILILTITAFGSIGIVSASFVMILKKGDPVTWIFTAFSGLLGGVYYPVSVLPEWLQKFSWLLPITHSMEGMRLALLQGYPLEKIAFHIGVLAAFSGVMLPLSILFFKYGVNRAKMDGSLIQY